MPTPNFINYFISDEMDVSDEIVNRFPCLPARKKTASQINVEYYLDSLKVTKSRGVNPKECGQNSSKWGI